MTRRPAFHQSDLTRILKSARAAGEVVDRVVLMPDGALTVHFNRRGPNALEINEWDEVLRTDTGAVIAADELIQQRIEVLRNAPHRRRGQPKK